jgi:hypothetical protein
MRFAFQPRRLNEVLEKVRRQHPKQKADAIEVGPSVVEAVRQRLEQTEIVNIPHVAYEFLSAHLMACIDIVAVDMEGETAEKAAAVAKLRPMDQMILRAWFKLVAAYPNRLLEQLLKELCSKMGYGALEKHPKVSNHVFRWLVSPSLPKGILQDYRSFENISLDLFLSEHLLNPDDALYRSTWLLLVTQGTRSDLKRQHARRLLREIKETQGLSVREQIGQHYLNTLMGIEEWNDSFLDYIYEQFGKPAQLGNKVHDQRFWQGVSEASKDAFRRWLIRREIQSFFEGVRAIFWRKYVDLGKVKDVQKILNGEGFMLDFGRFGVVEFKNVGNAAYIYPQTVFKKFWDGAGFSYGAPPQFKDLRKTLRSRSLLGWDGRIMHHRGWQEKSKYRIDVLLAEQ